MTYRCSKEHHEPLGVNQCVAPLAIKCYFCGDRTRNGLRYDCNCGRNVICPIVNRIMFIHRHELWIYRTVSALVVYDVGICENLTRLVAWEDRTQYRTCIQAKSVTFFQ